MTEKYQFISQDGETLSSEVTDNRDQFEVLVGDQKIILTRINHGLYACRLDGCTIHVAAKVHNGLAYVDVESSLFEFRQPSDDTVAGAIGDIHGEKDKVYAPMPGKIVKLLVAVGDEVEAKQPLLIVEAMKMENQVLALASGTVKAINFSAGDQVDTETPIIELELHE